MTLVRDLFEIEYGQSLSLNKLRVTTAGKGVAFVSRTSRNNGVSAWVEKISGIAELPAGLLTVCLRSRNFTLATFVQPRPFYCGYHIFVLRPKKEMSLEEKLWWAECIAANRYRYNFGRQANRSLAELKLPDSVPDWVKDIRAPVFERPSPSGDVATLETGEWKTFHLADLFDVVRGRHVLRRDMRPGGTVYVSALSVNNGVSAWIDTAADYPAGAITVASNGNGVGSAFYQPQAFIASGDVTVLLPKSPLSTGAALFVCTLIFAEKYRWNYGRKWTTGRIKESSIRLPVGVGGQPDWDYADRYMKQLRLADAVLSHA